MIEKLLVPDIGDFENVEIIELLVKEGQEIKKNDPIITIESDKSSVEIPSIFSGKIESSWGVGDKVSKGDLILNISSVDQKLSSSQEVPKNTENLIQEAESSLKTQEQTKPIQKTEKENEIIQIVNEGDIDPLETNEWLESLSDVIEKDGNQRAHYLIKELINKAYMEGANIPYTQNTPYINTIPSVKKNQMVIKHREKNKIFNKMECCCDGVRANKKFPELEVI